MGQRFFCEALTGGAAKALDSLKIGTPLASGQAAALADKDSAIVFDASNNVMFFEFQAGLTDAENVSTHPYRVRPDDYSIQGVWYEQRVLILSSAANEFIINPNLADVTSKIILGRTTGGSLEISWNGVYNNFNQNVSISGSYPGLSFLTDSGTNFRLINRYTANRFSFDNIATGEILNLHSNGAVSINAIDLVGSEKLLVAGDIYGTGNVSALSFTDRTPHYEGDALSEIMLIKGKDGELDHSTLPGFARKAITKNVYEDIVIKEVEQEEAFETVEAEQDVLINEVDGKSGKQKTTKVVIDTVEKQDGFKIKDGQIVPNILMENIFKKERVSKQQLKKNMYFDAETGTVYQKISDSGEIIKDGEKILQRVKVGEKVEEQRDLGAMISILTVAVQQLMDEINILKSK